MGKELKTKSVFLYLEVIFMIHDKDLVDLEELLITIYDTEIQELMKEAINCYNIGAYRAAIILTWDTVLYDSYKKAKYLAENFDDKEAKKLVLDVEEKLKNGSIASEWSLIENYIYKKFEMIDNLELQKLSFIKELRNMSAHMSMYIIKEKYFVPTAEDARMCIRNAIEILLSQPPILNKKAIEYVFEDIFSKYFPEVYDDFEKIILKKYIEKAGKSFLRNLTIESVNKFLNENSNMEKLRNLIIVLLRNKPEYFEDEKVKRYLNSLESDEKIEKIISLIMEEPKVLECLVDGKIKVRQFLEERTLLDEIIDELSPERKNITSFLMIIFDSINGKSNEKIEKMIENHIDYINLKEIKKYKIYNSEYFPENLKRIFLRVAIDKLSKLPSFIRATSFIENVLSLLLYLVREKQELELLFERIKENKGVGKVNINQILASGQSAYNLETIFTNLPKDTLIKNRAIVEEFINYYCEKFSAEEEKVCEKHFFKICFEK